MSDDFVNRFAEDPVEAVRWFLTLEPHAQQRLLTDPAVARGVVAAAGLQQSGRAFSPDAVRHQLAALRRELKGNGSVPQRLAALIDILDSASPSEVLAHGATQADALAAVAAIPVPTLPMLAGRAGAEQLVQGLEDLDAGRERDASAAFRQALEAGDPVVGARAAAGIAAVAARRGADAVLPALATAASLAARGNDAVFGRAIADRWEAVRTSQVGAEQARAERQARWPRTR